MVVLYILSNLGTLLYLLGAYYVYFLIDTFALKRPRGILIVSLPSLLGRCISSINSLLETQTIVRKTYASAKGSPFTLPMVRNYHVFVSDPVHVRELCNAPTKVLSLNAALGDFLQPKYTIAGFEFLASDPHSKLSVTVTKQALRNSLPSMVPQMGGLISSILEQDILEGKEESDWRPVSVTWMAYRMIGRLNASMLLGEGLASQSEVLKLSLAQARDTAITVEVLNFLPKFTHRLLGPLLMGASGASAKLHNLIVKEIHQRLSDEVNSTDWQEPVDCIQWFIKAARQRGSLDSETICGISQRTLGMILASGFQMPIFTTFAIYKLCEYHSSLPQLREEAARLTDEDLYGVSDSDSPLLDSFLKEVARLFPLQVMTHTRKVVEDFRMSKGIIIPSGNWIGVPQQEMMLDENVYKNATQFDALRFTREDGSKTSSRFLQPSAEYPFWGPPSRSCPGRFYVSAMEKLILRELLIKYDMKVMRPGRDIVMYWRGTMIPRPGSQILLKRR